MLVYLLLMVYFLIFLLELGLLFYFSKKLIKSLFLVILKITNSHKALVNILAILFLPGTIIHELSHLLVAGVMLIPVGEISVLPEVGGDGVKLGSVQIGKSDPVRRILIGVAPVLLGVLIIIGILYFINLKIWWQVLLGLYLIFEIGNTMFSSKKDLAGLLGFILAILLVGILALGALYFLRPLLLINIWIKLNSADLTLVENFFKKGAVYLLIPLILDLIIIIFTGLFTKRRDGNDREGGNRLK